MLSIDFIKNNLDRVRECTKNKRRKVDFDKLLQLDEEKRKALHEIEILRAERNRISEKGKDQSEEEKQRNRNIKEELKKMDEDLHKISSDLEMLLLQMPNVYIDGTPIGNDEKENIELRKWGTIPNFDFPVKDHIELAKLNDLVDFERGSKVSGFRGYFLKNEAAVYQFKILSFAFNTLVQKGYTPLIAPALVKEFAFFGNGQFPWGREEVYNLEKDKQYLAGTAEVPVTAYFSDEVLEEKDLPKKFVAFSPCYRREAGSYGKDTKGLYRVHEFWKIEQVIITKADIEEGLKMFDEILNNSEEFLQAVKLPYRVMQLCSGEMGEPQYKKYDIETWMPSRNGYGETMSCSFMTDFQARRLNIRYKEKSGKIKHAYTLNNTAIASPRILIPIIENNQTEGGKIMWPQI
jgi:seryl-tRNA synthetase